MKSLADFTKKSKVAEANITRDKFYKNEVYKKGEWVLTEQGQVGKIHRRGPNYVLCLTAENTKFRSWITDIKEVFEIGTDAYREYVMSITPGQKVQKPKNTVKVPEVIPSKHPTNKMDKHESKSLAQVAAETMLNPKFKSMKETWRYDYSAKIGNTDIKGLGAKGVGGGDAPGMKLAEPAGQEGKPTIKKVEHSCATKVEHAEWGKGNCLKEMHTLDEEGNITHYDVMFEHGLEQNVPVPTLNILVSEMHEHVINDEKNEINEVTMEVKGIFSSIKSSINGMSLQMARIGAISQNIANAEKLPDEDGNVYKRKVVKQSGYNSSGNNFDQQLSIKMKKTRSSHFGGGNELSGSSSAAGKGFEIIELDEIDKIYDPNNPLAGDDGYVVMPKINTVEEMVDLVSASRNYEANISVLTATKNMAKKAMDI